MKYLTKARYTAAQNGDTAFEKAPFAYAACAQTHPAACRQIAESLCLHDARITYIKTADGDTVLHFDNADAQTAVESVVCKGATEEKNEHVTVGDFWLYEEVYPLEDGFRICALLETAEGALKEWQIRAKDVIVSENRDKVMRQEKMKELLAAYKKAPSDAFLQRMKALGREK